MKKILGISLLLFIGCQQTNFPPFREDTSIHRVNSLAPFYHGVASGDPLANSVVLWTRVTPEKRVPEVSVNWEISPKEDFSEIVSSGSLKTDTTRDYTVKIIAENLQPSTFYYYRFQALNTYSAVGRTKTTSESDQIDKLTFGVVSCSNYEWGYFNSYAALAKEELDAVVHLGDYIYEYGRGSYGDTTSGRLNLPPHEIISLQDYRTRYSQYRLDPDLQAAHARHPFITIWDDHEITNNSYTAGAQNHQENEGPYVDRKKAAVQAYYEWLPIRDSDFHYRQFTFGSLVDLFMLDERLEARTQPVDSLQDPRITDPSHKMIGDRQLNWLTDNIQNSKARWKIIGNQVIFSYLDWGYTSFSINLDSWDGYPGEQKKVADFLRERSQRDVIFITGDTHSSWALEVTEAPFTTYNGETGEGAIAVEFGTTSINSSNANERFPDSLVLAHEQKLVGNINPHLKYTNLRDHGFMLLTINQEAAIAEWKYVETLRERNDKIKSTKRVRVAYNDTRIQSE